MASYVVVDRDGRLLVVGWIVHFIGEAQISSRTI